MKMFRKKPVLVEAVQIVPENYDEIEKLDGVTLVREEAMSGEIGVIGIRVETLEGTMTGNVGDWIIRGIQGELYPCKPDIFAATYDELPDGAGIYNAKHEEPVPITDPTIERTIEALQLLGGPPLADDGRDHTKARLLLGQIIYDANTQPRKTDEVEQLRSKFERALKVIEAIRLVKSPMVPSTEAIIAVCEALNEYDNPEGESDE